MPVRLRRLNEAVPKLVVDLKKRVVWPMVGKLAAAHVRQLLPVTVPVPVRQLAYHAELRHPFKLERQTPNGFKPLDEKPLHTPPHNVV